MEWCDTSLHFEGVRCGHLRHPARCDTERVPLLWSCCLVSLCVYLVVPFSFHRFSGVLTSNDVFLFCGL
jgi:hypothetical protein